MNDYSEVVKGLKKFSPRALAFSGSYGMGLQDNYSHDVDIVVYTDRTPTMKTKEEVFASLSDDSIPTLSFPYDVDIFGRADEFHEVAFKRCRRIESEVAQLVQGKRGHEEEVAIFVYYTKILYDDGWLNAQKARIRDYPQKLLATNLSSCLFSALRQVHYYERAIKKRKQPYWAEICINEGLNALMHAIFAANRTYYGKYKWTEVQCRNFKVKPQDFERRLVHVMRSRSINAYRRLVLDVCTVCQRFFPQECADVVALDSRLSSIDDHIESKKRPPDTA